jgi:plasmid stabilization system protein ParE
MKTEFLETAEIEFYEAITFYNLKREWLGFEFSDEVKSTIQRIKKNPEAWTLLSKSTRRCLTDRFPYGIIYQIRKDTILIVSVMHLKRHPRTWRDRLPTRQH